MSGNLAALDALIARYGDALVVAVIEALKAERAAARAAKKGQAS